MSADPTENGSQGSAKDHEPVDSEVTPVGGTSEKLLELSEGGDQNTRAYRAPRELLELARRQRNLGFRPSQPAERHSAAPPVPIERVRPEPLPSKSIPASPTPPSPRPSSSSPALSAGADHDASGAASSQKRRVRPVSLSPSEFSEGEAAPPRPIGEPLSPRERPTRRPGRQDEQAESSAPSISYQPASSRSADSVAALEQLAAASPELVGDAAPPVARSYSAHALSSEPSSASPGRPPASLAELVRSTRERTSAPSVPAPSPRVPANDLEPAIPSSLSANGTALLNRGSFWALIFVLFIVIGFVLARWHVLDLVLPPAR